MKHVEAVFRRTAAILNLHIGGKVIRTTRRTGEVFKVGQTSTTWTDAPSNPNQGGRTRVDGRWTVYLTNQLTLTSRDGLTVDSMLVFAFSSDNTVTLLGNPERSLRTEMGGADPNKLLWDNSRRRLRDAAGNRITSGSGLDGLAFRNGPIELNWLTRASSQGFIYRDANQSFTTPDGIVIPPQSE